MIQSTEPSEGLPSVTFGPFELADFVRYAGASGDMNPLHFDDSAARRAGYPSVFSQGMFQAGLLGSCVTQWFPAECVRRIQVRFLAQVWPGDVVTCEGVVATTSGEHNRIVTLELTATKQSGELVVTGSADVELDDE